MLACFAASLCGMAAVIMAMMPVYFSSTGTDNMKQFLMTCDALSVFIIYIVFLAPRVMDISDRLLAGKENKTKQLPEQGSFNFINLYIPGKPREQIDEEDLGTPEVLFEELSSMTLKRHS